MRYTTGGIAHMAGVIEDDLVDRDTGLQKPHIKGLADLSASMLACRSVNTSELLAVLPRSTKDTDSRFRYINRWLQNPMIDHLRVMRGFIPEIAQVATAGGKTIILMMDQTKIAEHFECLMVSLRVGERAIPVAWTVKETRGGIGFDVQKPLLDAVCTMMPQGVDILLAADRFYGTAALIAWCKQHGWNYRIRLKENLILHHEGGEITTGDAAKTKMTALMNATLNATGVTTHIGILHEKGHKEPWIIAMHDVPTKGRVLDYGMRWGIESMFSDFKSRGFGITKTQLKHADRIERLILILTIALFWAASTGMSPPEKIPNHTKKNKPVA
jgi:Transposase DDE domain